MERAVQAAPTTDGIVARLPRGADVAVVRDGAATVVALDPVDRLCLDGEAALHALDALDGGWWAGWLSYDLGRCIERVPDLARPEHTAHDLVLTRFATRIEIAPDGTVDVHGNERSAAGLLDAGPRTPVESPALHRWTSSLDREAHARAVDRILEHLAAGDCYQVNLTRQLRCERSPEPVDLFRALRERHPAPHEAFVRCGDEAVVSASPERFLRADDRRVETRPIKGTATDAAVLASSAKDKAENVMIVDLARNDIGRVCEYGSVHVPALCDIEPHPGLFHLVSTVRGTLRPDVGPGELIGATFPPASVTGCPKPRVLEIIELLEPVRRGVYCGAVGWIDADRRIVDLNVAIRTFTIAGGRTYLGVGGGIVADSDAEAEWDETELKAQRLLAVARGEWSGL